MNTDSNRECEYIRSILPAYSVGSLGDRERVRIERHTEDCRACAAELRALDATGVLLNQTGLEESPDQWDAIRGGLRPRKFPGLWPFLSRYRLQSAIGAAVAIAAVAVSLLMNNRPPVEVEARTLFVDHASMSWREPFADRAALGMASVAPVEARSEDAP